jgi:RNA polymerase sigma factor (sigma-70 family)
MIKRVAASDEIETLYRERFPVFVRGATALLRDGDAALEVVQDAFALALRHRRRFRREGTLEAWVWRVVLNTARDRLRASRRAASARPPLPDINVELLRSGEDELKELLLALPERQRAAIFLRYYADLSYAEIADALGVQPGTVAASLNKARDVLRGRLQEVKV